MKVFEVITERTNEDTKEVTQTRSFVTSEDNTLKSVVDHFTKHCDEYEYDLLSVRDVLTIVQHIKGEK
jgi:hypothetical protein